MVLCFNLIWKGKLIKIMKKMKETEIGLDLFMILKLNYLVFVNMAS